ncbi:hypothetical protein [Dyella caseinilytica]|uniref:Major facilitator superfamily (MFS) profile domain-containing protein n=1 Tax=Dyella caseinilytica TaxID=1849581 RepID=A0ABX7GUI4_9GAMM|nr:hypothetical protein [Dyella caseinilytica]QRN53671.1 hypothetical protein ISN74_20105 [Dyella caseinilytica]GFZ88385.1 hypothetical protein GCM10011408_03820 [Dyella caseinilytica]
MNKPHITLRKIIVGAGSGLAGVIVGGALVRFAAPKFNGSAPWLLPAIVIGTLTVLVMAALIVPTILSERRRAKHKDAALR